MTLKYIFNPQLLKSYFVLLTFFSSAEKIFSQKPRADSISGLLKIERTDTNRVRLMWQLASSVSVYNPDSALSLSQQALFLANRAGYLEGQSRSLGIMANIFMRMGNFPKALEINIKKLQLEEKRNRWGNLGSVLMNIGIVYVLQDEYRKALEYYTKADSVISKFNIEDLKYNIALNVGDAYNRLDISDSAYMYFNKSLEIAKRLNNPDFIGTSMTGLGHSYKKLGNPGSSLTSYQSGINYLRAVEDDEILCEATLGLASLYQQLNENDSAANYAILSLSTAKKDGFLSQQLEASEFLTEHYKKIKNIDSAFAYAEYSRLLNDSVNSKVKIRELQLLSTNEQFRQRELEEERQIAAKRRYQELQLLLIGIFIPGLFLVTLLLSRQRIHVRVIKALGILSLLFFFEYLTLWLHPKVADLTGHTPVFEILIFVGVAAILIPLHHRTEHWLINRLITHRVYRGQTKKLRITVDSEKKHPSDLL
jgi:tetratricopeptide (TPR) repeat protein